MMSNKNFDCRLISAVQEGKLQKVKKLFHSVSESTINDVTDKNGFTVLCIAALKSYVDITDYLLTRGASAKSTLKNGYTALHYAVNGNCKEIVKLLLINGADVNAKRKNGATPLHNAIERGYFKMAKLLLKHGADPNSASNCAFSDVKKSVIRAGCTPLHLATKYGYKKNECTPCEAGHIEMVKALIKSGADVNFKDLKSNTALHFAAKSPCSGIIEILLKSSADTGAKDENGKTALHIAAQAGLVDYIEILLKYEADTEATDANGKTPLHRTLEYSHVEAAMTLLKYGSDINSISSYLYDYAKFDMPMLSDSNDSCEESFYAVTSVVKALFTFMDADHSNCDIILLMKHHIVKMKVANLYVCELNLQLVNSDLRLIEFEENCEKEMERLKNKEIAYNVTLHDIVTKNINQLAVYVQNKDVYKFLKSSDYEESFPIYASLINARFRMGVERKELLEQCYYFFNSSRKLPPGCTDKILSYLTNRDIKILVQAFKY